MGKAAPLLVKLRTFGVRGVVSALDEYQNEWVRVTEFDFPEETCGICGQPLDAGWMQLYPSHKGTPPCPFVVCKRHCVVDGVKPPKYRSIDDP